MIIVLSAMQAWAVDFYGKITYRDGSKCGSCRLAFEHSGFKDTYADSSGNYSISMSGGSPMCVNVYHNGSMVLSNVCANSSRMRLDVTVKK
ncbi:MAG: hypothetical protein H7844_11895 [Nitrospirae bacterium YQR-1]